MGVECLADTLRTVLRRPVEGGYILVLQTNGRSGSYNPHLHIIMTSGGIVPDGRGGHSWVTLKYFPYTILHKKWQYHLFRMLQERVPTREMQAKIDELYRNYPDGLVANIQKGEVPKRIRELAKYLAKYVVSPPISVRRIVSYDGKRVRYWYQDHKSGRPEDGRGRCFSVYWSDGATHPTERDAAGSLLWASCRSRVSEDLP